MKKEAQAKIISINGNESITIQNLDEEGTIDIAPYFFKDYSFLRPDIMNGIKHMNLYRTPDAQNPTYLSFLTARKGDIFERTVLVNNNDESSSANTG